MAPSPITRSSLYLPPTVVPTPTPPSVNTADYDARIVAPMQQPYGGYPQAPMPPKKGMGALGIVLIILGVLFVLGIGTCVGGYFWVKGKVSDLVDSGALDLVSPPAVTAALAGPK